MRGSYDMVCGSGGGDTEVLIRLPWWQEAEEVRWGRYCKCPGVRGAGCQQSFQLCSLCAERSCSSVHHTVNYLVRMFWMKGLLSCGGRIIFTCRRYSVGCSGWGPHWCALRDTCCSPSPRQHHWWSQGWVEDVCGDNLKLLDAGLSAHDQRCCLGQQPCSCWWWNVLFKLASDRYKAWLWGRRSALSGHVGSNHSKQLFKLSNRDMLLALVWMLHACLNVSQSVVSVVAEMTPSDHAQTCFETDLVTFTLGLYAPNHASR